MPLKQSTKSTKPMAINIEDPDIVVKIFEDHLADINSKMMTSNTNSSGKVYMRDLGEYKVYDEAQQIYEDVLE